LSSESRRFQTSTRLVSTARPANFSHCAAIIFDQTLPSLDASLNKLVQLNEYDDQEALTFVQISVPSFYRVRPDGNIELCGKQFDESTLRKYFVERLSTVL
jgi:hypothetical protein